MFAFMMKIITCKLWFTWSKPTFCFILIYPTYLVASSLQSEVGNIPDVSQGIVGILMPTHYSHFLYTGALYIHIIMKRKFKQ